MMMLLRRQAAHKTPDYYATIPDEILSYGKFNPLDIINAYEARYPEAYAFTLSFEGGYVNHPDDPGGCTNMGITIGTLGAWRGEKVTCADVKALSKEEAAMIYATNYWAPVWGNRMPVGVNTQVWDWGVNSGPKRALQYLQRLVGSTADGIMGPKTLEATEKYVKKHGINDTLYRYSADRQQYYESLSTFDTFGNGWTRRNEECLALSIQLAADDDSVIELPTTDIEARVAALEAWASSYNKEGV